MGFAINNIYSLELVIRATSSTGKYFYKRFHANQDILYKGKIHRYITPLTFEQYWWIIQADQELPLQRRLRYNSQPFNATQAEIHVGDRIQNTNRIGTDGRMLIFFEDGTVWRTIQVFRNRDAPGFPGLYDYLAEITTTEAVSPHITAIPYRRISEHIMVFP